MTRSWSKGPWPSDWQGEAPATDDGQGWRLVWVGAGVGYGRGMWAHVVTESGEQRRMRLAAWRARCRGGGSSGRKEEPRWVRP